MTMLGRRYDDLHPSGYRAAILALGIDPARSEDPDLQRLVDRCDRLERTVAAQGVMLEAEIRRRRALEDLLARVES